MIYLVTEPMFHSPIGWLKSIVSLNIESIIVAELVSHLLISSLNNEAKLEQQNMFEENGSHKSREKSADPLFGGGS